MSEGVPPYPNRQQLASFIKDPMTIRAFEYLFKTANDDLPAATAAAQTSANEANSGVSSAEQLIATINTKVAELNTLLSALQTQVDAIAASPIKFDDAATPIVSSVNLIDYSAGSAATLGNSPVVGDPTKWIKVDDNGTPRYSPLW